MKMQAPLPPEESLKHIVVPGLSRRVVRLEPELGGKAISMNWMTRRLWVCETYDYPNELQPQGEGATEFAFAKTPMATAWADKFTVLPRSSAFDQPDVRPRRRHRLRRHANRLSKGHQRRRRGRPARGVVRRVVAARYARRPEQHAVWARQLDLGDAGYNPSNSKSAAEARVSPGVFLRFKPDGTKLEFGPLDRQQHLGAGHQRGRARVWIDRQPQPSVFMPIPNRYYEAVRAGPLRWC